MERLRIPETYQKPIQNHRSIQTLPEQDEWEGVPYRPLSDCPECKGTGFVHPRRPDGSVNYGETIPCRQPLCLGDGFNAYLCGQRIEQSGVIGLKQTFETFNKSIPGVQKAYNAAVKIAEGEGEFIWLLIFGGVGNGKTHLLNAIANRVMERGISAKLAMMADLLSELRMSIETKQTDLKMKQLKEVPYLLIDELGLEYGTEWEKEKVEELLASRWANGRFTVVATNRDIEELPERIKSRFKDKHLSRWIQNEACDYRVQMGSSRF